MRRALMRFLPVFLLALTVQILAPVGACLARAAAAGDPLAATPLCQGVAADHKGDQQQQGHDMRTGSCAVCAVATPFAPPAPQAGPTNVERHAYQVAWHAYAPDERVAKFASAAQARGPPKIS